MGQWKEGQPRHVAIGSVVEPESFIAYARRYADKSGVIKFADYVKARTEYAAMKIAAE